VLIVGRETWQESAIHRPNLVDLGDGCKKRFDHWPTRRRRPILEKSLHYPVSKELTTAMLRKNSAVFASHEVNSRTNAPQNINHFGAGQHGEPLLGFGSDDADQHATKLHEPLQNLGVLGRAEQCL
jgi:hypothetical protein